VVAHETSSVASARVASERKIPSSVQGRHPLTSCAEGKVERPQGQRGAPAASHVCPSAFGFRLYR
jgi:hypothetical protein